MFKSLKPNTFIIIIRLHAPACETQRFLQVRTSVAEMSILFHVALRGKLLCKF